MFDVVPAPDVPAPDDMVAAEPEPAGDRALPVPEPAVDDPAPVPGPAADVPAPEPAVLEPVFVLAPDADIEEPEPDDPAVDALLPPGTIAGEPDVVESVPVAAGRSDDGAVVVDCAKAGAPSAVATRHAAICFFSMVEISWRMQ